MVCWDLAVYPSVVRVGTNRDTPCWGLTVLPRKKDAASTLRKLRAEFACVPPFKEVQNRAVAHGELCPHFPVLFHPMASPSRSHRIVWFGRDFKDSSLLSLAVERLSGGVIVVASPEESKAEGGAAQKKAGLGRGFVEVTLGLPGCEIRDYSNSSPHLWQS